MTNQEIFELISRFESSSIRLLRLSSGDFMIELSKDAASGASPAPAAAVPAPQAMREMRPGGEIKAPLAGVFYRAAEPGAKPYVAVGDRVQQGQTVCLMEAMKTISEIPAPCDCTITEILKQNGELAAFDEPLFRYQPC